MNDFNGNIDNIFEYIESCLTTAQSMEDVKLLLVHIGKAQGAVHTLLNLDLIDDEKADYYFGRIVSILDLWNINAEIDEDN